MARADDFLNLVLEKSNNAEPVSIAHLLWPGGTTQVYVLRRGEFTPPLPVALSRHVRSRLEELESRGGIADLLAIETDGQVIQVALEVVRPRLRLAVFGAGHVGQAVALIGSMLGYDVLVVDDREEFASRKRFPDRRISLLVSDFVTAGEKARITAGTAVVIVTRGHQSDEACLRSVLRSRATYLGMIGSRRRVLGVFKKLSGEGISEAELGRVHAPVGLKIGARTPQEIAVSILAEIIEHVNNPSKHNRENADGI